MNVLVVDDDPELCELVETALELLETLDGGIILGLLANLEIGLLHSLRLLDDVPDNPGDQGESVSRLLQPEEFLFPADRSHRLTLILQVSFLRPFSPSRA